VLLQSNCTLKGEQHSIDAGEARLGAFETNVQLFNSHFVECMGILYTSLLPVAATTSATSQLVPRKTSSQTHPTSGSSSPGTLQVLQLHDA
jgi:hypothetical protein